MFFLSTYHIMIHPYVVYLSATFVELVKSLKVIRLQIILREIFDWFKNIILKVNNCTVQTDWQIIIYSCQFSNLPRQEYSWRFVWKFFYMLQWFFFKNKFHTFKHCTEFFVHFLLLFNFLKRQSVIRYGLVFF